MKDRLCDCWLNNYTCKCEQDENDNNNEKT